LTSLSELCPLGPRCQGLHGPTFRRGTDCPLCYRRAYPDGPPSQQSAGPCRHRGEELTAARAIELGLEPRRLWAECGHPERPLGPYVCPCAGCGPGCRGYQQAPQWLGRRHLVYHVLPVAGNGVWQRGADQLRLRWGLFTGRKVVAVATGESVQLQAPDGRTVPLDTVEAVRRRLPADAEVLAVPNDPGRWELSSWPLLWSAVLDGADPADVVLYAHAKGVTRPTRISLDRYVGTPQLWAEALYRLALDHWPAVEAEFLRGRAVVGPLLKPGYGFAGRPGLERSAWHFSGNFWWAKVGGFRWPRIPVPVDPWGTEAWVGMAYAQHEAGQVGPVLPNYDPYSAEWWNHTMVPALAEWSAAEPARTPTTAPSAQRAGRTRLSIVVATQGRPTLGRTLASITSQIEHGDELIVERDSSGDWGCAARTRGIARASGDYLLLMDDDDAYTPGAFAAIRRAVADAPGRPHMFRMAYADGRLLWDRQDLAVGNVSTQMFVAPLDPFRLGAWTTRYEGDFDFISTTLANYPAGALVWSDQVVARIRPEGEP